MSGYISLEMKVEVKVSAGTDISHAATEAAALANRLGIWVRFDFNEVACHVAPGCEPEDLVEGFHKAMEEKRPGYRMAFARTGGNHKR